MKISFFSSWMIRCGIADYSAFFVDALKGQGVEVLVIAAPAQMNPLRYYFLGRSMNAVQIAHIQYEPSFFGSRLLISIVNYYIFISQIKIPRVITIHEIFTFGKGNLFLRIAERINYFLLKQIFSHCDAIIVHSIEMRNLLYTIGIAAEVLLHDVPVPSVDSPVPARGSMFVKDNNFKRTLAIFGFVNNRKNYELVLKAMQRLPLYSLIIAGGKHPKDRSAYYSNLKRMIKDFQLESRVRITGYLTQKEILGILSHTNVILAPFRYSVGSSSLGFAIACGKAIIASDIPYMKELKEIGIGIELFREDDINELVEKISLVMEDNVQRERLEHLTKHFRESHGYPCAASDLCELYSRLIKGGSSR
jgi:glycosyltransferase involved in cell wall biosynthesis